MVLTIHTDQEELECSQKRPRINNTNKGHVQLVWGENHTVNIKIPLLIDDYNHWILGVDLTNQIIVYYCQMICC